MDGNGTGRTEDIVDWNVNQLDEKPDKAHDEEPDRRGLGDAHEFLHARFLAPLEELGSLPGVLLRQRGHGLKVFAHCLFVVLRGPRSRPWLSRTSDGTGDTSPDIHRNERRYGERRAVRDLLA